MRTTSATRMRRSLIALSLAVTLTPSLAVAADTKITLESLSSFDRKLVDSACTREKYLLGPAAYRDCIRTQLQALTGSLTPSEKATPVPKPPPPIVKLASREPSQAKQEDAPTFPWKKPEQPAPVVVPQAQPPRRANSKSTDALFWLLGGTAAPSASGTSTCQSSASPSRSGRNSLVCGIETEVLPPLSPAKLCRC